MLLLTTTARAEPDRLAEAQRAQEAGDYAHAATLYLPLAINGDSVAQLNLGVLYTQGQIIQPDYRIALQWYLAAAEQGNAQAQAKLGELYTTGAGIPQDFKKALHWLTASAKQGNAAAQQHLGEMYAKGQGAPQDFQEAVKWYQLAAAQGSAEASSHLAQCNENGQGTPQDSAAAVEWLNKAAGYATDLTSHNAYLARRDVIAKKVKDQEFAKQQQLARAAQEREKAAAARENELETARLAAARIVEQQAAIAQAAEKARQKAAADAALQLQIKAYKQAKIEAQAEKLRAQQEATAKRKAELAERQADSVRNQSTRAAQLNAIEDRRRAMINAEAARNLAAAKKNRGPQASVRHPIKPAPADAEHPLLHENESKPVHSARKKPEHVNAPVDTAEPQQTPITETKSMKPKPIAEQHKAAKRSNVSTGKLHYPAKTELTDEELGNTRAITGKKTEKQIEGLQKTEHD